MNPTFSAKSQKNIKLSCIHYFSNYVSDQSKFPDISCVRREGFIEIRSTQPMVLAADSWKSVAASAGERAVRRSIAGQSPSSVVLRLRSVCRTTILGVLLVWVEKLGIDRLRLPADCGGFR